MPCAACGIKTVPNPTSRMAVARRIFLIDRCPFPRRECVQRNGGLMFLLRLQRVVVHERGCSELRLLTWVMWASKWIAKSSCSDSARKARLSQPRMVRVLRRVLRVRLTCRGRGRSPSTMRRTHPESDRCDEHAAREKRSDCRQLAVHASSIRSSPEEPLQPASVSRGRPPRRPNGAGLSRFVRLRPAPGLSGCSRRARRDLRTSPTSGRRQHHGVANERHGVASIPSVLPAASV